MVSGQQIVVMDRGWVYVGDVCVYSTPHGPTVKIEKAKNIRRWGTTKGLGELTKGPLKQTVTDIAGTIVAPLKSVIHFIACKGW